MPVAALRFLCFCLLDPKFKCFVTTIILIGLMDINLMWPSKEVLKITIMKEEILLMFLCISF